MFPRSMLIHEKQDQRPEIKPLPQPPVVTPMQWPVYCVILKYTFKSNDEPDQDAENLRQRVPLHLHAHRFIHVQWFLSYWGHTHPLETRASSCTELSEYCEHASSFTFACKYHIIKVIYMWRGKTGKKKGERGHLLGVGRL